MVILYLVSDRPFQLWFYWFVISYWEFGSPQRIAFSIPVDCVMFLLKENPWLGNDWLGNDLVRKWLGFQLFLRVTKWALVEVHVPIWSVHPSIHIARQPYTLWLIHPPNLYWTPVLITLHQTGNEMPSTDGREHGLPLVCLVVQFSYDIPKEMNALARAICQAFVN